MNLLDETKEILKEHGKNIFDIIWFGNKEFTYDTDIQKLFDIEYDDGFGVQEISDGLIAVGADFWIERHEYDGSEWWEYKAMPIKPEKSKQAINLLERY